MLFFYISWYYNFFDLVDTMAFRAWIYLSVKNFDTIDTRRKTAD